MEIEEFSVPIHEIHDAYPMCFGVSCAFVALHLISKSRLDLKLYEKLHFGEMILQGSAHLLGLMVWKAQRREEFLREKLTKAEREVVELKCQRTKDAKANEKVVSIFAAHQQNWLGEKKQLKFQIRSLVEELQDWKAKHEERGCQLLAKEDVLQEECKTRKELEEMLRNAEEEVEKVRENAEKEVLRHKNLLSELVLNKRQVEAEIGQLIQQLETMKEELVEVSDRREEAVATVEKLSKEIEKLKRDVKQKDKILSAMLRQSKFDAAERKSLLQEVNITKTRMQQVGMEKEKWRKMWATRHKKSFRGPYYSDAGSSHEFKAGLKLNTDGYNSNPLMKCFLETESTQQQDSDAAREGQTTDFVERTNKCSSKPKHNLGDIQQVQPWVCEEAEKDGTILKQRHYSEIKAFMEQLRFKDEKIETLQWQLLNMELDLERLQSHTEGLDGTISMYREEIFKLEALLLDKDKELKSVKDQIIFYLRQYPPGDYSYSNCNKMKVTQKRSREKEEETELKETIPTLPVLEESKETPARENSASQGTTLTDQESPIYYSEDHTITCLYKQSLEQSQRPGGLLLDTVKEDFEEEKEVIISSGHVETEHHLKESQYVMERKSSTWKEDAHALTVSYKIKRLKQQLLVVEKLSGSEATEKRVQTKGLPQVISWLNKQVKRYQSLEEKINHLCTMKHENDREGSLRDSNNRRMNEQTEVLQGFLDETFRLQRYVVAMGQKLMEIESRVKHTFAMKNSFDESIGFNIFQFAKVVRTLLREVQRGFEVRIAQIIGDLEGTLASERILHK